MRDPVWCVVADIVDGSVIVVACVTADRVVGTKYQKEKKQQETQKVKNSLDVIFDTNPKTYEEGLDTVATRQELFSCVRFACGDDRSRARCGLGFRQA